MTAENIGSGGNFSTTSDLKEKFQQQLLKRS